MNTLHKILLGVFGGGGFTATTSWYVYDNLINPTLAKRYKNQWSPIQLTIDKPPKPPSTEDTSSPPYKGSSCFQRFFENIEIQKFSALSGTLTNSLSSSEFKTLFKNSKSDIYGCAVGEKDNFYEVVIKNEKIGFATWYDSNQSNSYKQRTFVLKKENNDWQIELGIWTTGKPPKDIDQIKNKVSNEKWSWWFYMTKDQAITKKSNENTQSWESVFKGTNNNATYDTSKNGWYGGASGDNNGGEIPKFEKVTTLDNYCNEQGSTRKPKPATNSDEEKKLNIYCLLSK